MVGTRHCYVCDADNVEKKAFAQHMQDHSHDLEKVKFSNSTSDYCRTACKICGKAFPITTMREHTKKNHNMIITEYKKKYNQEYFDIVEKVFHKCGLCHLPILLDSDVVASHLVGAKATHNMSHKEYNLKYMVLQQVGKRKTEKRKSEKPIIERGLKVMKYTDLQTTTVENSKEVKDDHPVIQSNLHPEESETHTQTRSPMTVGKSLLEEELNKSEKIPRRDDGKLESKTTEERFVASADDVDSNERQTDYLLSHENENSQEEETLTIQSFRDFIASITEPGMSPVSYPAIERVLGMDVTQEEHIVTGRDGAQSKWTKLSTSFNNENNLEFEQFASQT